MTKHRPTSLAAGAALVLVLVAACAPTGSPSGSPSGSAGPTAPPTPTAAPTVNGIQHATGSSDILLRIEESGGFMPIEATATYAPSFTLYGDGTVVFRNTAGPQPDPIGNVNRLIPFQTIRLGEEGIQALLAEAIGPGGLGIALGPYMGLGADIPATTFTITADGQTKQVTVVGLSPDMHPQNAPIVATLARLAERLHGFGDRVAGGRLYVPTAYRAVLRPIDQPFGPVVPWPWTDVQPSNFAGENEFFLTRTMTPAEIAEIGIPGVEGGFQGVTFQHEGKLYTFALRPLLPDETK